MTGKANSKLRSVDVFGHTLVQEGEKQLADALLQPGQRPQGNGVVCINPHSIVVARDDPEFAQALDGATIRLCDGVGVVLAARLFGQRRLKRITGRNFFDAINERLNEQGGSALFVGGTDDWNERLLARLKSEYPNIRASSYAPPFRPSFSAGDVEAIRQKVNAYAPDVLWLGVGSPKQEKLLAQLEGANFRVGAAIGAVFDFYSGRVKPSPPFVRNLGLEWLFRLVQQPRRLGARTFVSAPRFLAIAYRAERASSIS